MKKIIILILLSLVAGLLAFWVWNGSGLRFVQKATGVTFPEGYTGIHHFDNMNHFMCGTLLLPKDKIKVFLESNAFRPITDIPTFEEYLKDTTGGMKYPEQLTIFRAFDDFEGFRPIEKKPNLVFLRGKRSNKWPWEIVVDPDTGQLWYEVISPDFNGD